MIAAALDVEGGEVHATAAGGAEEGVAEFGDDAGIGVLVELAGEALEEVFVGGGGFDGRGVEEGVHEAAAGDGVREVVVVDAHQLRADHGVTEAEEGGGELVGDAGIDRGVVAEGGGGWCGGAEEGGEPFVVGDGLDEGADDLAGPLVDLLVGPGGVCGGDFGGEAVVFRDEEGVHGGEAGLLVGADVAGHAEFLGGDQADGAHGEAGGVVGEHAVGFGFHAAASEGAEGGGGGGVGAVDVGGVDEGSDGIDLLADPGAVGGEVGAAHGDEGEAGVVEDILFVGDGDGSVLAGVGGGEGDVVVEELSPLPDVVGSAAAVGFGFDLIGEEVGDVPGVGSADAAEGGKSVGVADGAEAEEGGVGGTLVARGVAGAVDGAVLGVEGRQRGEKEDEGPSQQRGEMSGHVRVQLMVIRTDGG